ncbi:hypothetical protein Hamer_G025632 [Homarus americanus]|uniref:Uncharacterized protein n=1 Tax=Homarus americanus TaxID=6706 RepID=A0A8J5J9L8_HOMAM|nr:hypothetical protein Hamer_G025632 [Homarus americanus]
MTISGWIMWVTVWRIDWQGMTGSGWPIKSYMLPLLTGSANSPITMLYSTKTIRRATEYLNPGQTPIVVADQSLFTLAKRLQ